LLFLSFLFLIVFVAVVVLFRLRSLQADNYFCLEVVDDKERVASRPAKEKLKKRKTVRRKEREKERKKNQTKNGSLAVALTLSR